MTGSENCSFGVERLTDSDNSKIPTIPLWVIMPVYNERDALGGVVEEWLSCFRRLHIEFKLLIIDDGSTDDSYRIIKNLAEANPEILVEHKLNSGHGQSCLAGYRKAIAHAPEFVFQIDSDGQCIPDHFQDFWAKKDVYPVMFGDRVGRNDGIFRALISRLLSSVVFICTGEYIRDSNVPYRLIRSDILCEAERNIPENADLANVFLSILINKNHSIQWISIGFRERHSGKSKLRGFSLIKKASELVVELVKFRIHLGSHNSL